MPINPPKCFIWEYFYTCYQFGSISFLMLLVLLFDFFFICHGPGSIFVGGTSSLRHNIFYTNDYLMQNQFKTFFKVRQNELRHFSVVRNYSQMHLYFLTICHSFLAMRICGLTVLKPVRKLDSSFCIQCRVWFFQCELILGVFFRCVLKSTSRPHFPRWFYCGTSSSVDNYMLCICTFLDPVFSLLCSILSSQ